MKTNVKKEHIPTTWERIEAARIERRKKRLEENHPVMEFVEDIIYCPSQIYFYFKDGEDVKCLYIRQRHGETTAQLVPCFGNGDFDYTEDWSNIELTCEYDIEGNSSYTSDKREEQEIVAIERECLEYLRSMFPNTDFPLFPNRKRGRYGRNLPDKTLINKPKFVMPIILYIYRYMPGWVQKIIRKML